MITMTTSSSSSVKPSGLLLLLRIILFLLERDRGASPPRDPRRFLFLVDAELHGRRTRLVSAHVRRRVGIVEVLQLHRTAEAGARRRELVHPAHAAAAARRERRDAFDAVRL